MCRNKFYNRLADVGDDKAAEAEHLSNRPCLFCLGLQTFKCPVKKLANTLENAMYLHRGQL